MVSRFYIVFRLDLSSFGAKIGMTNIPYREPDPERLAKAVSGLKTANDLYRQFEDAQRENAASQRKQDRKNVIFTWANIVIAALSLLIGYLSYSATLTANAATVAAADATNKQLQLEAAIHRLQLKLTEYQAKNDSMRTIGEEMNEVLKRNGASD